ncbi:MAG: hypothetical protein SF053_20815 [Bacteroidia bacterium]|nr:hypothetical protein [Bacteroidia bacterium]
MRYICLMGLGLSLLFLSACWDPRQGALSAQSRTELDTWAASSLDVQKKYLKLAEKTAMLLQEAVSTPGDDQAMELIRKFAADNDFALRQISDEFDGWVNHTNDDDLMEFIAVLNVQPYSKTLRELEPIFRNRISYNDGYVREFDAFMSKLGIRR